MLTASKFINKYRLLEILESLDGLLDVPLEYFTFLAFN